MCVAGRISVESQRSWTFIQGWSPFWRQTAHGTDLACSNNNNNNNNNNKKISPIRDCSRLLRNLRPFQVRSHVTQKLGQISKICSVQKLDIVL